MTFHVGFVIHDAKLVNCLRSENNPTIRRHVNSCRQLPSECRDLVKACPRLAHSLKHAQTFDVSLHIESSVQCGAMLVDYRGFCDDVYIRRLRLKGVTRSLCLV